MFVLLDGDVEFFSLPYLSSSYCASHLLLLVVSCSSISSSSKYLK